VGRCTTVSRDTEFSRQQPNSFHQRLGQRNGMKPIQKWGLAARRYPLFVYTATLLLWVRSPPATWTSRIFGTGGAVRYGRRADISSVERLGTARLPDDRPMTLCTVYVIAVCCVLRAIRVCLVTR
jgi:hypothetical protein